MKRIFVFLLGFYFCSAKIKIKELKVPPSIESREAEDVILDCDFESEGEKGVVVKWFRNGDIDMIYQWIPQENKPGQAIGPLKENIDVKYKITNDRETMYRALHIVNLTPDLSGNYTCKVSGDYSEDSKTKSMIIYEPSEFGIQLEIQESDRVVTCEAGGLYPKPNLRLYISNDNESEIVFEEEDETIELIEDGFFNPTFNVSSILEFDPTNLTNPFYSVCELDIPGTDYFLRESKIHYLDLAPSSINNNSYNTEATNFLHPENDVFETQIEEDYLNLLNTTNTTETSFLLEVEESVEFETQIEGDVSFEGNVTSAEEVEKENERTRIDNASSQFQPSLYHIVFLIAGFLLSS